MDRRGHPAAGDGGLSPLPRGAAGFFDADAATLAAGIPALRILCLSFLPAGISILLSSAFQALGAPSLSLGLSLLRQVILIFPLALLLGFLAGSGAVWYAFVIAEVLPCIGALALYRWFSKTKIDAVPPPAITPVFSGL